MRNFLWPRDLKQEANLAVRIGRAIQWLSVAAIAVAIFSFVMLAVRLSERNLPGDDPIFALPLCLATVAALWGIGRLSRYIIAGE